MRLLFIILLFLLLQVPVFADYVLPYPSYMPGHKLYKVSRIIDELKRYWYWGNIAQAKYHQGLSDKYLVEAKTLFEYRQYPLALDALKRSDEHFQKGAFDEARETHTAIFNQLMTMLPETFVWQDEYKAPLNLNLHASLNRSLQIRNDK